MDNFETESKSTSFLHFSPFKVQKSPILNSVNPHKPKRIKHYYYDGDVFQDSKSPEISSINMDFSSLQRSPQISSSAPRVKRLPIYMRNINHEVKENPVDVYEFRGSKSPIKKIYQNQFPALARKSTIRFINRSQHFFGKAELKIINNQKEVTDNLNATFFEKRDKFHRSRSRRQISDKMWKLTKSDTKKALKTTLTRCH